MHRISCKIMKGLHKSAEMKTKEIAILAKHYNLNPFDKLLKNLTPFDSKVLLNHKSKSKWCNPKNFPLAKKTK